MVNHKKSLQHQHVNGETPDDAQAYDFLKFTGYSIFAGCIFVTGALFAKGCVREPMPTVIKSECAGCHRKQAFIGYFKRQRVKSPELMAEAVLKTDNPRLLAAINVGGEKKTPHTAMRTGYKGRHSGAWQTSEHWGKITKHTTVTDQALIAEFALESHVAAEKNIIEGLNAYGGELDKKEGKYAFAVLKALQEVPK